MVCHFLTAQDSGSAHRHGIENDQRLFRGENYLVPHWHGVAAGEKDGTGGTADVGRDEEVDGAESFGGKLIGEDDDDVGKFFVGECRGNAAAEGEGGQETFEEWCQDFSSLI